MGDLLKVAMISYLLVVVSVLFSGLLYYIFQLILRVQTKAARKRVLLMAGGLGLGIINYFFLVPEITSLPGPSPMVPFKYKMIALISAILISFVFAWLVIQIWNMKFGNPFKIMLAIHCLILLIPLNIFGTHLIEKTLTYPKGKWIRGEEYIRGMLLSIYSSQQQFKTLHLAQNKEGKPRFAKTLKELEEARLISGYDDRVKGGYRFKIYTSNQGQWFFVICRPVDSTEGIYSYYIDASGKVTVAQAGEMPAAFSSQD